MNGVFTESTEGRNLSWIPRVLGMTVSPSWLEEKCGVFDVYGARSRLRLRGWRNADNPTVAAVRDKIKQPVRPLLHVANSLPQIS